MLVEVPLKPINNAEHPMYKTAIREALVIIDNEIEEVMTDRENETTQYRTFYNDGKLYGLRRIRGLLAATIEEGTE